LWERNEHEELNSTHNQFVGDVEYEETKENKPMSKLSKKD
jgi:hypothetical protein